ncbi:17335_t:CDS:1, partial [Racocetra fulgida]
KKYEYDCGERLKEQNRREKNYKQTIERLEQTIDSLRNQLNENVSPRY